MHNDNMLHDYKNIVKSVYFFHTTEGMKETYVSKDMEKIYIQYTYILYIVGWKRRTFGGIFWHVSQRVQINVIFTDSVRIMCLSCNIKK